MCDEENNSSYFFDDDFVRENLRFLMEDDFVDSIGHGTSLNFRSFEEESSIFETAKINSTTSTSWSPSSFGSIPSVKEEVSEYVNVCLHFERNQSVTTASTSKFSLPDTEFGESYHQYDDNSFLLDFPSDLTSTPTKKAGTINAPFLNDLDELSGEAKNQLPFANGSALLQKEQGNVVDDIRTKYCRFCLKNGEPEHVYKSHLVKNIQGIVICPILRKYVCELCGQTGDYAHTRKYCTWYSTRGQSRPATRLLSNGIRSMDSTHK
ncbi:hypothetical protein JTB14_029872 [Gonioctena quinquepunctata]|nr:hypothetical protein JTB14_029872 [Gonioctena quinquepunctata]